MIIDYFYLKLHGVETKYGDVKLLGFPIINKQKGSKIILGNGLTIISKTKYNLAGVLHRTVLATLTEEAIIEIGSGGMSGAIICATKSVRIGNNTALGVNVKIYDTDFHSIDPIKRVNQTSIKDAKSSAISIGNYVWIAADSIILKGVNIQDYAVVGAGSVIRKNIGYSEMYAGNPAKLIKKLSFDNLEKEE